MRAFTRFVSVYVTGLVAVLAGGAILSAGAPFTGVSLKVSKEPAPPGGMAQVKVFVTEPKPISTGRGGLSFSALDTIDGIALMSAVDDAMGVAVVRGTNVDLSLVSPSATFGMDLDYPVLTVAGRVPVSAPLGTKFPMVIDPASLALFDAAGAPYPTEVKQGHMIAALGPSVHDVLPGSADLDAGSVVTIVGSNFVPDTKVKFKEVLLSEVRYIDSTRIDVVLAAPARMHGMAIRVENPDGTRSVYYSYQRTRRDQASADATLRDAVPVFPRGTRTLATVEVAGIRTGIALQNILSSGATATLELVAIDGTTLATTQVSVPSARFVVRELSEVFGIPYPAAASVRMSATAPLQVMGIALDEAGAATPIPAR